MQNAPNNSLLYRDAWNRFKANRLALICASVLAVIVLSAIFAPLLSTFSYSEQDIILGATAPSSEHWFGTDTLGRDLFTRVLYGSRISLMVGVIATLVAVAIGVLWGVIAGYVGGTTDAVMMRIVDILYGVPFVLLIVLLMVVFGRSLILLFLAIGAVEWMTMARIVRGQVMFWRNAEFVEAARVLGVSNFQIIIRHIMPNILGVIVVYATLTTPNVIILEAFLSFLGLGVQPPNSSWGLLINYGVESMQFHPWLLIFPGIFFSATLFSLNIVGDSLRDAIDPKSTSTK